MARLTYEHTKKHEDTVKKRMLTKEDIEFLKDLQHEMNTQDTVCQADPRYWGIMETERVFNLEDGETLLVNDDNGEEFTEMEGVTAYIDRVAKRVYQDGRAVHSDRADWIDVYDGEDNVETFFELDEAADWLKENGERVRVTHFEDIKKIHSGPIFLTLRDADEHLRLNYYHYADDAHAYAMTAWRDPTIERLWKILQEIDWEKCRRAPATVNQEFDEAVQDMIGKN